VRLLMLLDFKLRVPDIEVRYKYLLEDDVTGLLLGPGGAL